MARPLEEHSKVLIELFRPSLYADLMQQVFNINAFFFHQLHRVFSSGKFKGEQLLDFGCGPTIYNVASASNYFQCIVSADFLDTNVIAVQKWVQKDPDALDWTPILEKVAKIEGFSDVKTGAEVIANRIRSRIKSVVHCDALADRVLPYDAKGDFDAIISSLCLEVAASTDEQYKTAIGKLSELLKPGGILILAGALESTCWGLPGIDTKLSHLPVTRSKIEEALREANLDDIDYHEELHDLTTLTSQGNCVGKGLFFLSITH